MALTTLQAPPGQAQSTDDHALSDVEAKAAAKVTKVSGTTEARIAEKDAESARRLRERQADVELRREELEAKRVERETKSAAREAKHARRSERRQAKRQARVQRFTAAVARVHIFVSGNMPAVYSSCIYAMALYVAVAGQLSMATDRGWNPAIGIGMAVFLEGLALSMALTAHQLRLKGERALVPAAATWAAAGFASAINFAAHRDDLIMASVLGASSLAAIIVWEVRSGAKHRDALRKLGLIPDPPERFGLRRWCRYPINTFRAWSLDVKNRVSPGAAVLLAQVEADRDRAAAATSAGAAKVAQIGATLAFGAAAREAAQARAAATEAVKAAKRTARPRRSLWTLLQRTVKDTVTEPAPKAPAPAVTATVRPAIDAAPAPRPVKPIDSKPRRAPKIDIEKLKSEYKKAFASAGKAPSARALGAAAGVGKSTANIWMRDNQTLLRTLEGASK